MAVGVFESEVLGLEGADVKHVLLKAVGSRSGGDAPQRAWCSEEFIGISWRNGAGHSYGRLDEPAGLFVGAQVR
jgi:hypothetical protein